MTWRKLKDSSGFTLVEFMITLTIFAILVGIATPSAVRMINNSRLTSNVNGLMSDLMMARSEASSRGVRVVVCPAVSNLACSNSATDWSVGRLIFADANADGAFGAGDTLIRYVDGIAGVSFSTAGFPNALAISFSSFGGLAGGGNGTFTLCPPVGNGPDGRQLSIDMSGRSMTSKIFTCP
jgi:type IV fimbrial biogenesis protein FimT